VDVGIILSFTFCHYDIYISIHIWTIAGIQISQF